LYDVFLKFLVPKIEMKKVTEVLSVYLIIFFKTVSGSIVVGRHSRWGRGIAAAPRSVNMMYLMEIIGRFSLKHEG
jgi:hypothetical protein